MAFWQLLKRDLRLLVPVSLVFLVLALIFYTLLVGLRLKSGLFSVVELIYAIKLLFFFHLGIYVIALSIDVVWKEWRQQTQAYWYTLKQSLHMKLLSKLVAVYLFFYAQSLVLWLVLEAVLKYIMDPRVYDKNVAMISGDIIAFVWNGVVSGIWATFLIMWAIFILHGVKGAKRFLLAFLVFVMGLVLSAVVSSYVAPENMASETVDDTFPIEIVVNGPQMFIDILFLILAYSSLYYFLSKKISL